MTYGSFLAITKDCVHIAMSGQWSHYDAYKARIADMLRENRYNLVFFVYAWGDEHQEYTPAEVREVYFSEPPR